MRYLRDLVLSLVFCVFLVGGGVSSRQDAAPPVKHPHPSTKSFTWRIENWGSCNAPGGCGEGTRVRHIWCSDLEGRSTLDYLCDPSEKPETAKPCFTACRHHRDKLQWQVGPWGPCLPVYPSSTINGQIRAFSPLTEIYPGMSGSAALTPIEEYLEAAGNHGLDEKDGEALGVMQREVACVLVSHDLQKTHRTVDDDNCFTVARKPDPVRLCGIQTPQDCIVSDWSDWDGRCPDGCGIMNETRTRTVLVAPSNAGKPCPELMETRLCASVSKCQIKLTAEIKSSINEYKLKVGEWRQCEAPAGVVSADVLTRAFGQRKQGRIDFSRKLENFTFEPQVGYQSREVTCRDLHGDIVDIKLCLGYHENQIFPQKVRPCVVSQDCAVGPWSVWSKIQDGCVSSNNEIHAEVHKRKRSVVSIQQGDGQPCPHLIEQRKVVDPEILGKCIDKYHWLPSRWSPCVVTRGDSSSTSITPVACGGGVQLRTLTCVESQSDRPVPKEMCNSLDPAPTVQRCEVACPRDCEVGQWSTWSVCKSPHCSDISAELPSQGYRERERMVRVSASNKGVECPAVREVQPCAHPACFGWKLGRWGPCELDPGLVKCGEGRKIRSVICESIDGVALDDFICAKQELKPPVEELCLQPCPFDCVLSPWSQWSTCSHPCSSNRQGALRQRNRTVVAPSGPGGHPCPDPDEMLQIEACNLHSCHGYSWFTMPWQKCELQNSTSTLNTVLQQSPTFNNELGEDESICGRGIQKRDVWCMEGNEKRVKDSKCQYLMKPADMRICNAPCPQNCDVSSWTAWSHCPDECIADITAKHRIKLPATQIRHRVVLKLPRAGGTPCPQLEEIKICPQKREMCKSHTWLISDWSQCQLPSNVECGQGYRTRAVACLLNNKTRVDASQCMQESGPMPVMTQPCFMDCEEPCVLSDWSSWTTCEQACGGTSVRRRSLLGLSASRPVCRDTFKFPLIQTQPCPCSVYESKPEGEWSICILDQNNFSEESANGRPLGTALCGAGRRFRARACRDKAGNLVEPSHCGDTGLEEEPCFVPCSADCVMGEWSTWGVCSVPCGPGIQKRQREVKMLQPTLNNGRPCGPEAQTKLCNTPCSHFKWAANGWDDCTLDGEDQLKGCGAGDQRRNVRCLYEPPHQTAIEVSSLKCDQETRPINYTACHVTCPGECVVSMWSDWSPCEAPCKQGSKQDRTRSILRAPAIHATYKCPPLIEVQECILNLTCFTYEWKSTEWSSCLPLGGSPCGEGIQHRSVACVRSDGRAVEDNFCSVRQKSTPTEKYCYVDCPVDCEVSEWSAWNETQCACGGTGSKMRRSRFILTNPSETGRPCPKQLKQYKPCPVVPCFTWVRDEWSKCNLYGADCGHGVVRRNVTCRREYTITQADEKLLPMAISEELCYTGFKNLPQVFNDRSFLQVALDLKKEDACYVPCSGDCEVGEWSRWSHCHRSCKDGELGGYQTRSRAVLKPPKQNGEQCPAALWETRPCFSGPCLTYDWVVKDKKIICERSDGEVVTGGCESKRRPCVPACSVPNSVCTPEGVCACVTGFGGRYSEANRRQSARQLKACVDMSHVQMSQARRALEEAEIQARFYYPKEDDMSVWMFAMIGVGCVFVVFVALSLYIMCRNPPANEAEVPGVERGTAATQTVTVRENPQNAYNP
ncbi:thrombospondin type-1 domain-containing protein 7B-like isoform X2 [Neocloeon triangulifer]|uniref:thrombospondin type-1 domain-containing protein 7B-like isoform X2 n=1 Tax=Neocloeon triangulifer TaxID=2078957 RepID=UPI00286FAA82|nr:thrombospondin type-1 domain-containing protein 7B-like isoform X2 [Neocloeon triangulifer]